MYYIFIFCEIDILLYIYKFFINYIYKFYYIQIFLNIIMNLNENLTYLYHYLNQIITIILSDITKFYFIILMKSSYFDSLK